MQAPSAPKVLSLLIPAVGGQGGGVLSEWIVDAALLDGFPTHGTSIPGVAQRTGSTTYYVELYTERGGEEPAFSLYPVPGALDVLVAPEFMEVGRMIELGFVSPARTTVICSTHRLLSIHEKIATGRAIYPQEGLQRAASAAAHRLISFDALALARQHGTEANAVLLGALAGSGAVPISEASFRKAIEAKGVAVKSNLAGFDLGLELARSSSAAGSAPAPAAAAAAAGAPTATQTRGLGVPAGAPAAAATTAGTSALPADIRPVVQRMPSQVREIVVHAIPRLVDYQDLAYARRYLDLLQPFVPADGASASASRVEMARSVARYLALWMTYEDAVRVADLKTRASRFERIRSSQAKGAEIVVTDFLKPDLDEIWGVLPDRLVRPFARWAERRWPHGRPTLGQHVRTTTVSGYLRVWLLARLRRWRAISYRAREEHARIARWLDAVRACAARDDALGAEVAQAAQLVKGYGDVRRRMTALHEALIAGVLRAAELEARSGGGFAASTALAARGRALVLAGPDGEAKVAATLSAALARLEAGDAAGALAQVSADYRPSENEPFMNERQREYFRRKLNLWKDEILKESRETIQNLQAETVPHADLADRASTEAERQLELRTRDRQRKLIAKIDAALRRIEDGSYGFCEETGEPISLKRLDARPIATLSIEAQERHERREKVYRDD